MGNATRLIAALSALVTDAAARPLPAVNLTEAAVRGDVEAVRAFLDGGADIEQRTIGFASPLAAAASRGNLEVVELLINRGADLDPAGSAFPLLHFPIVHRRLDVVERLLQAGAPAARYREHVQNAARNGHWDMVDVLLAGGADPLWLDARQRAKLAAFVRDENPRSPDYRARLREQQERQFARDRVTPAPRLLPDGERERHEAAAIAEIDRDPALARAASESGTPVLALAVTAGARDLVARMLACGADPDAAGPGETPLARAAARSDTALVTTLLEAGANPAAVGPGSPHPVLAAARAGSLASVEVLLARGARPRARDLKQALEDAGGPDATRIVQCLEGRLTPAARRQRTAAVPAPPQEDAPGTPARTKEEVTDMADTIEGKVFSSSGAFENLTQVGIQMSVEIRGGIYGASVTKKTEFLVAGATAGAKLEKARAQGVRILTEADFHALLERIPITEDMKRRFLG